MKREHIQGKDAVVMDVILTEVYVMAVMIVRWQMNANGLVYGGGFAFRKNALYTLLSAFKLIK